MAISYSWVDERLNYTGHVDLEVQAFTKVSKCLKSYASAEKLIEGSGEGSGEGSSQGSGGTCDPGESIWQKVHYEYIRVVHHHFYLKNANLTYIT